MSLKLSKKKNKPISMPSIPRSDHTPLRAILRQLSHFIGINFILPLIYSFLYRIFHFLSYFIFSILTFKH